MMNSMIDMKMFGALICSAAMAAGCASTTPDERADADTTANTATLRDAEVAVLTAQASAVCAPDKFDRAEAFLDAARQAQREGDEADVSVNATRAIDMSDQVKAQYALLWPNCEGTVADKIDDALEEASPNRSVSIVVGIGEVDQGELNRIYFSYDQDRLDAEDKELLYKVDTWLEEHPNQDLVIEGHADERGTDAYNLALGERRAYNVKKFLVTMGVEPERLRVVTYGEEDPAVEEADSPREYRKNRRVEFEGELSSNP